MDINIVQLTACLRESGGEECRVKKCQVPGKCGYTRTGNQQLSCITFKAHHNTRDFKDRPKLDDEPKRTFGYKDGLYSLRLAFGCLLLHLVVHLLRLGDALHVRPELVHRLLPLVILVRVEYDAAT